MIRQVQMSSLIENHDMEDCGFVHGTKLIYWMEQVVALCNVHSVSCSDSWQRGASKEYIDYLVRNGDPWLSWSDTQKNRS
jgi:hypothetical protein